MRRHCQFVAHLAHPVLRADQLQFGAADPAAEFAIERNLRVDRHHMVEIDAVGALAAHVGQLTAQHAAAIGGDVPQRQLAVEVDAVELRVVRRASRGRASCRCLR